MTKLMEWLSGFIIFLAVYVVIVFDLTNIHVGQECKQVILFLPIYLLIAFACYSLAVIGYRVATFNDCTEASEELKKQIQEAKIDLKKKGYTL